MKFCMITTFFGRTVSAATPRTSIASARRSCRRGHEVHVYYCVDALNAVRGDHPLATVYAAAGPAPSSA